MTELKVVGLTFVDAYPANLHSLSEAVDGAKLDEVRRGRTEWDVSTGDSYEHLPVVLVRNPGNVHDANAIEVHVPALGTDAMVGHIPAKVAARWAPLIDSGAAVQADVLNVLIDPDHLDKPGLEIQVTVHTLGCDLTVTGECTCQGPTRPIPDWEHL